MDNAHWQNMEVAVPNQRHRSAWVKQHLSRKWVSGRRNEHRTSQIWTIRAKHPWNFVGFDMIHFKYKIPCLLQHKLWQFGQWMDWLWTMNCWNCSVAMGMLPYSHTNGYWGAKAPGCLYLMSNYKGCVETISLPTNPSYHYACTQVQTLARLQFCWCSLEDSSSFPQCTSVWGVAAMTGTQFVTCVLFHVSSLILNYLVKTPQSFNGWMAASFKVKTGK
jgi:hypothetical protein